jgi:hypothetical protein
MRRFIRRRGVGTAVSILLGLASGSLAISNRWNDPWLTGFFYAVAIVCFILAAVCWFVMSEGEGSGSQAGFRVKNSPGTTIEGNVPKENLGDIKVENSPDTEIRLNIADGEGEKPNEDRDDNVDEEGGETDEGQDNNGPNAA